MALMIGPPLGKIGGNEVIESKMWFTSLNRRMDELQKDWTVDYGDWLIYFEGTATGTLNAYHYPIINGVKVWWSERGGNGHPSSGDEGYGSIILRGVSQISMRGYGSRGITDDGLVILAKIA